MRAEDLTPDAALAMEKSGIGVYFWNPVTRELSCDDAFREIFGGKDPSEPPMDLWNRRVHPDDRDRVLRTFSTFAEAEDVYRLVMPDGTMRHVLSRATHIVRDADGEPTDVSGVIVDVTPARRSGEMLAAMLDSISDGFIVLDREFRFTYVNRKTEQTLGRRLDELLGHTLWEEYPRTVGTQFETAYRTVMEQRVPRSFVDYYGDPLDMWVEVRALPWDEGIVIYFQDVSERQAHELERERLLGAERRARHEAEGARRMAELARSELAFQAAHDPLTGLANRAELERIVTTSLRAGDPLTLLFLDLDRFKLVNDSLGHAHGDDLLVAVAHVVRRTLRSGDVAARIGGDEFVVVLDTCDPAEAEGVARRLLDAIREPVTLPSGATLATSVSIGLADASPGATFDTLLRDADVALYRAKDSGRDALAWFDSVAHDVLLDRIALERDLRIALDGGQGLDLHFQPFYALDDLRLLGVEALARWHHDERGHVPPASFISVAEETGLIMRVGSILGRIALHHATQWADLPGFTLWVNVSGRQLTTPNFAPGFLAHLADAGLSFERIGLEVTESVFADHPSAVRTLAALVEAGVPVAIDDFGTGYSSLARLASLPVSTVKIDRSFVTEVHRPFGRASVDAVVHLSRAIGLHTIAEGVETVEQLELLREAGVDSAAGYLLGRPAPADELDLGPARLGVRGCE